MALFDRQKKKARKATTAPATWKPASESTAKAYEERSRVLSAAQPPDPAQDSEPSKLSSRSVEPETVHDAQEVENVQEAERTEPAAPDLTTMGEALPSALEPELRNIIDTAVARVAEIELAAIREARTLTQRSEEEGREALKYALDRAFQVLNSFELLTESISGMVAALRIELDDALDSLRTVHEPQSELSRELDARRAAREVVEEPAPASEPVEAVVDEPVPEPEPLPPPSPEPAEVVAAPSMNGAEADVHDDASPEMTAMFRQQIENMKDSGKTREEAERSLLRFNLGRRYLGLLHEIYGEEPVGAAAQSSGLPRKKRVRRFFTR